MSFMQLQIGHLVRLVSKIQDKNQIINQWELRIKK